MNATSHPARRPLLALVAVGLALGPAACGGSDGTASQERAAIGQQAPPAQTAATATAPATTTPAGDAKAKAKRRSHSKARSKAKSSSRTSRKAKRTRKNSKHRRPRPSASGPKPATVPKPPTGTADPPGRPSAPIDCLEQAGLADAAQRSQDTWGATAHDGTLILVDGPYDSAAQAQEAVSTMKDVVRAEAGGVYIASAPLRSDAATEVSAVARCLKAKG
jgi:hypothetical protein